MPLIWSDRVKETTSTTGTGAFALGGAATGFRAFSTVMANADTCYYAINVPGGADWEVGLGTYTTSTNTLARTTILASSNNGSAVNFGAGPKDIFITEPAAWVSTRAASGVNSDITSLTGLTAQLAVVAGTVSAPGIAPSGDSNTGLFFPAADTIAFAEGGVEAMRLDSSGRMALGTTTANARFTLAGDYSEGVVTANTGTAYTIALTSGTVQILTLTGNCTFTFPTATAGQSFILLLRQDGTGSRTVTWPASVRWPGGTAPTITSTASRTDKYVFTADGTNWLGSNAGQNYSA